MPNELLNPVLTRLKGYMEISKLQPIIHGEESLAYRFRSGTRTNILRINPAVEGFQKDALAYRKFQRPNLPVPEIIEIGEIDDHFFCVSENMPGVTLQDLAPGELAPLLVPTARTMEVIAQSNVEAIAGFGPFTSDGVCNYRSWGDFLTSPADPRRYDWGALGRLVDRDLINRTLDRVTALAADCPETRELVHGDFGSNNVLTDGRTITGVVDWSEALIGDSLYDVANIFFWSTWLDCMQQQARYFEAHPSSLQNVGGRLLCYQLRIGMAEIYESAVQGKEAAAAWATSRCFELLD